MIRTTRLATFLALSLLGPVGTTHGAVSPPPRLASLLARARLAVAGTVSRIDTYEDGRVTVAHVRPDRMLKGDAGPGELSVVEEHDRPSSLPLLRPGEHVVAFLQHAERTSSLARTLPAGPRYFRLLDDAAGLVATGDAESGREAAVLVGRMAEASTDTTSAPAVRAERARALVVDEVAARHPRLVADGGASLSSVGDLGTTMRDDERTRLERALQRTDLPDWVRVTLVSGVGTAHLAALAPTLRALDRPSPAVLAASWVALRQLGQPPTVDDLAAYATNGDPAIRAVVPAALLAAAGDDAIPQVEAMALKDKDLTVRRAAVDALGATRRESAIPSLERIFRAGPVELRQASALAYTTIGGRAAAESLARLAFEAPPEAQRFAATILLALVPKDDPLVANIRATHPDPELRDVLEHGPYLGHHHE